MSDTVSAEGCMNLSPAGTCTNFEFIMVMKNKLCENMLIYKTILEEE